MNTTPDPVEETTHRGVTWRRDRSGAVWFLDRSGDEWVRWAPGVDAPPLPPRWSVLGVATRVTRPGWRSQWRIVPVVLVVGAVVIAVIQVLAPGGGQVKAEARAASALQGQCLEQNGTAEGHPRYSANPVPCDSPKASVKVQQVLASTPGSPLCPSGTTGVELPYPGVQYPHVECLIPVPHGNGPP